MLELPPNFANDIQGKDTALVPVVLINTWGSQSIVGLSINHYQVPGSTLIYKPLLLNIPSLKESIDIETRNYKISSVNIDISNFPYNGKRFSDTISEDFGSFINTEVRIFWASPSGGKIRKQDHYPMQEDDALQIYFGTIRRYTHDDEKVRLVVEDRSQATLHKDLPLPENYLTGDDVPDKYKNKPIPMVYGHVDRSPCVIKIVNNDSIKLINDSNPINTYSVDPEPINQTITSELFIYDNNYINIPSVIASDYNYIDDEGVSITIPSGRLQYITKPELGYIELDILPIDTPGEQSNFILSPSALAGQILVEYIRFPESVSQQNQEYSFPNYTYYPDVWQNIDNLLNKNLNSYTSFSHLTDSTTWQFNLIIKLSKINVPDIINISNPKLLIKALIDGNQENGNYAPVGLTAIAFNGQESSLANMLDYDNIFNDSISNFGYSDTSATEGFSAIHEIDNFDGSQLNSYDFGGNDILPNYGIVEKEWVGHDDYNTIAIRVSSGNFSSESGDDIVIGNISSKIYKIAIYNRGIISFNTNHNFYANVMGREMSNGNSPNILSTIGNILTKELLWQGNIGADSVPENYINWQYAFTIYKKINSKKLIEGIASASPFIPRFDNMGNFKFDVIPMDGGSVTSDDHHIKEADVIGFSFPRTKIEQVFTKIVFKYNWDYAREEFNDSVVAEIQHFLGEDYKFDYYGFTEPNTETINGIDTTIHPDSTLVIDDDRGKYIRVEYTAQAFADWYLMWSCNQHLKMKIKLPLKYMNLEIGDFVDFDAILGGVKPYGIDYINDGEGINSQEVFKNFLITSTNKTLEWVEIECIQMHDLEIVAMYTTFNDDIYYDVIASPELNGVLLENLYGQFPELGNLTNFIHSSGAAIYYEGLWYGGLTELVGGDTYAIKFSQETTTNLFQLIND